MLKALSQLTALIIGAGSTGCAARGLFEHLGSTPYNTGSLHYGGRVLNRPLTRSLQERRERRLPPGLWWALLPE